MMQSCGMLKQEQCFDA